MMILETKITSGFKQIGKQKTDKLTACKENNGITINIS